MFSKADYMFSDIYDSLVINHNKKFIVNCAEMSKKQLKKLKKILNQEGISYLEEQKNLVCFLDEKHKQIASEVYTTEVLEKLQEEKRQLEKEYMKTIIRVVFFASKKCRELQ